MKIEKRIARSYKATDKAYKAAMRRARKEKVKLSNLIENFVLLYGKGISEYSVEVAHVENRIEQKN